MSAGRTLSFEVIGQAGPRALFERLRPERLAHGYLFHGPPGVGKKTFAKLLAKSLLCTEPKAGVVGYCGCCPSCVQVEAGTHPDLFVSVGIVRMGTGGAGFHESEEMTARDLVRQMSLRSYSGGWRVVILGDIEFATHEAANALLKFLEEPPPQVLMILTTDVPERLLATIRSRMIGVRFGPVGGTEIEALLRARGAGADQARTAAGLAQGDLSRALAAVEGGAFADLRRQAAEWLDGALRGGMVEAEWVARDNLEGVLREIKRLLRDWLVVCASGDAQRALVADESARLASWPRRDPARIMVALAAAGEAQEMAATNVPPGFVLDWLRVQLA
ncbi:DNA polymerase III subunit delta' [bacterium]|nr:MAG: DNA polymerase III subunit delta' [bacterium]